MADKKLEEKKLEAKEVKAKDAVESVASTRKGKELQPRDVLTRVYGCGGFEADAKVAMLAGKSSSLVEIYESGKDVKEQIDRLFDEAADKAEPK